VPCGSDAHHLHEQFQRKRPSELWLVLRETPGSAGGYLVVFDAERGMFGLAIDCAPTPGFIGLYGSFTETLAGM
jgi:hypothetical protein